MSYVVPFKRYRPGSRDDGIPFIEAEIYEAPPSETEPDLGDFVLIDTIPLSPVDANPAKPALRSFTTSEAQFPDGWYYVSFVDANGDRQDTSPVQIGSAIAGLYYASADDVRAYLGVTPSQLSDDVIEPILRKAQYDIDAAAGGWELYEDTGLKFASDEFDDVLTDDQLRALVRATCAQVEYRMTMGDEFMVKEQYESQSGPGYSTTGQLRKVCGAAYTALGQGGLLHLHGKATNRRSRLYGDLPRAN